MFFRGAYREFFLSDFLSLSLLVSLCMWRARHSLLLFAARTYIILRLILVVDGLVILRVVIT